ncbi:nicotinate (nicotinamide) nucleotide adenylyltransferase [Bradymonadaceae bacterium TMQ3]|uniref:Probable nicotinate-nucleotide adenylyltransferase n=1 Tax=Lujinxingia sediminis TaxID=2480984 RepID=A0ABY0CWZ9_9DELT|nr:nicotinate (nicotinamide) nucleotide adenylyltransferase [Lujinxingia sediminis]RDV39732.1 nicotinate (nicotinamide) nucleotide adenylyltransferase [Bradymonadaceae bacterium TMQ3]RVU48223.1 nicotinate (nicotinamide) nucleotide adenylyltransferase [Lujinxingia sediminis]TXC77524.1 nicotinate (nicotinamide) nucleotide adenylyltransferase [Bradymonadales bacterium TMQ1]
MTDPQNVALFGGSFNPPHVCHTLATLWVLQTQPVDEVWWIPTYQHAFNKDLASFEARKAMCQAAVSPFRDVRICEIERELGGESRTIDTVSALQERHPHTRFSLVVGADILSEVDRWKRWDELMTRVNLIVVGRRGHNLDTSPDKIDLELPDISSTIIRDALARCDYESVRAWIPADVLTIIDHHQLYLGTHCA